APLSLTLAALETVTPLLARGGAGGLAWHRLRQTSLRTSRAGQELRQHYRLQTLQVANQETALGELLPRLQRVGVEPILIKGWSSARLYPEPGLRPAADVDLCVPADRLAIAAVALPSPALPCPIDLHGDVPDLPDRGWEEIWRRSHRLALG